ncbi:MAG: hypothetical protein K8F58_09220 [Bauldia sp.]|nr:hypothetical protein [Bauldia sp.]
MNRIAVATIALTLAAPAAADELVWQFYPAEPGGTLAVMDKGELESPEPYWRFALQCIPGEEWTMTVAGIDAAALGAAIAESGPAVLSLTAEGAPGGGDYSGLFPELRFGEMYGEWEYLVPIGLDTLKTLATAKSLAVTGTGIDLKLPEGGMAEGFASLVGACAALEGGAPRG